jgi:hypothetical protein
MRQCLRYLRFSENQDYEDIKDLPYFDSFQDVLYRIVDNDTKFPRSLIKVSLYNLSFVYYIPEYISSQIVEIRILRTIDCNDASIFLRFKRLRTLYIREIYCHRSLTLKLPDSLRTLYILNVSLVRIDARNLKEIYAPHSQVEMLSVSKELEKLSCSDRTNAFPSKSFILLSSSAEPEATGISEAGAFSSSKSLHLPDTLEELYLGRNIGQLPLRLPKGLKSFSGGYFFTQEIESLPQTLVSLSLDIQHYYRKLPKLPSGLKALSIKDISMLPDHILPNSLRELVIGHIPEDMRLPNLKVLYTKSNISNLPETLEELHYFGNSGLNISNLPKNLKKLYLNAFDEHEVAALANLSELKELTLIKPSSSEAVGVIPRLSSSLKRLTIQTSLYSTNIISLSLPDSIQELTISGYIKIDKFPYHLKKLSVDRLSDDIELPSNLEELAIHDFSSLPKLPHKLKKLDAPMVTVRATCALPRSLEFLSVNSIESPLPSRLRVLILTYYNGILRLPDTLEVLKIFAGSFEIQSLPKNLRVLSITGDGNINKIENLPEYLEKLRMPSCQGMTSLPKRLKILSTDVTPNLNLPRTLEKIRIGENTFRIA